MTIPARIFCTVVNATLFMLYKLICYWFSLHVMTGFPPDGFVKLYIFHAVCVYEFFITFDLRRFSLRELCKKI